MYDCIYILTEFRTGGGAFLVIQCSCKKWKKLTIIIVRKDEEQVLLVVPYWPNRTWFPKLMLLATSPPWQIPLRRDLLSQKGGTLWHPCPDLWSLNVPTVKTPVDARSGSCSPFCKMGWSEGGLPPPSKCMLPLSPHIMMQLTVSLWGSMTWSSGSSEGRGG